MKKIHYKHQLILSLSLTYLRPDTKHSRTNIGISQDGETQRPTSCGVIIAAVCNYMTVLIQNVLKTDIAITHAILSTDKNAAV